MRASDGASKVRLTLFAVPALAVGSAGLRYVDLQRIVSHAFCQTTRDVKLPPQSWSFNASSIDERSERR